MSKLLLLDEYEAFSNPAILIYDTDTDILEQLTINLCSLPDNKTALNIVDYPFVEDFLTENHFVEKSDDAVLSEGIRYPVCIPIFTDEIDVTASFEKYKNKGDK